MGSSLISRAVVSSMYIEIRAEDCLITLEQRPHYCDRGTWLAHILVTGDSLKINLDDCDGWPRYYFFGDTAKKECEEWLRRRHQKVVKDWEVVSYE